MLAAHTTAIAMTTFRLVTTALYLRGLVTAMYLSTLIMHIVTIDAVQKMMSQHTQMRHRRRPNICESG